MASMPQLPLRLHVHVRKFDITCDPHSPASALITQAKALSVAHPNITLEVLFNKSRRCVVDLRQPIHTSIRPHDEVEATSNLLVPDDSFINQLPPSVKVNSSNSSHRFFQQLCALDGMGQQAVNAYARQEQAKTTTSARFVSLLHLYYTTPHDDNAYLLAQPAPPLTLARAVLRRDSHRGMDKAPPLSPGTISSMATGNSSDSEGASPVAQPEKCSEVVDEFDVIFTQSAIGLKLAMDPTRKYPTVQECLPNSEAARYPAIVSGVAILTVNGDTVVSMGLTKTLAKLRDASRPVVIRFGRLKAAAASWHDVL
ncbi:hypothetical protein H310_12591 [Aphanomyces invadans]|uniref:PDZ domain-containing protein n=1 Tax=Aphanomyces invadans TaxID=157072 RepID=A0A024TGX2_9STRA|nr:hypothetical protein H310_12591 [Aphanomyces invadans]ETV93303.1 hypothetical protein H310_12591 [Aphanomyces invadans]|eukprot:XP_008877939.1 hypothetical protein H310_12591 [Aphanomyces invadans]